MAGPLSYDFFRTLRSKTVITSMAVIIALSLGIIPVISLATGPTSFSNGSTVVVGYYRESAYHLLAYSHNSFGQAVRGTSVNVTLIDHTGSHTATAPTNSSGYSSLVIPGDPGNLQISYSVRVGGYLGPSVSRPQVTVGEVWPLSGYPIGLVTDPANSSRLDALFFFEGANGTEPSDYRVYYNYSAMPLGGYVSSGNQSQMTLLGTPIGYATTFPLPPAPRSANTVTMGAYPTTQSKGDSFLSSNSLQGATFMRATPNEVFTSFTGSILSLIVPLMAILVAYASYGKDKASGVLESVLAQPVTRRGLGLSRYFSIILSISASLVATVAVMELISLALLGSILSASFALYTILSLIVEAAAFVGTLMMLSHLMKSTGGLLGLGVGLWIIFDFFWGLIVVIVAFATKVQIGSGNFLGLSIDSGFFNPAQFYSLVGEYLNGVSISTSTGGQIPISPATYGLTPLTLILDAAVWVLVPAIAFLYTASRRD